MLTATSSTAMTWHFHTRCENITLLVGGRNGPDRPRVVDAGPRNDSRSAVPPVLHRRAGRVVWHALRADDAGGPARTAQKAQDRDVGDGDHGLAHRHYRHVDRLSLVPRKARW